jgi:hypothetical protein
MKAQVIRGAMNRSMTIVDIGPHSSRRHLARWAIMELVLIQREYETQQVVPGPPIDCA